MKIFERDKTQGPCPVKKFHDVAMTCWSFPWLMTCCLWNSLNLLRRWCSCSCCWIRKVMIMMMMMVMTCLSELLNRRARAMEDLASGEWSLLFFRYSRFPQSVRLVSRHRTQIFGRFPRQLGKRRRNQILTQWASFSGFPIALVMIELHNDAVRENIGQADTRSPAGLQDKLSEVLF